MREPTPRQVEVVAAVVSHGSYACAAEVLGIRPATVRNHLVETRLRMDLDTTLQVVFVLASRGALVCPHVGRRGYIQPSCADR